MAFSTALLVGAALAGAVGAANEGNKGRRAASTAAKDRMNQFNGIDIPDIDSQELDLLIPQLVGEYDPEVMSALNLDPSAMEDISVDASIKQEQLKSLAGLSELSEGGLSEADKAASRSIQREVGQNNEARQQAILQNMAARGTLGSGMELASRMSAAQNATDQQSRAGDQLAQQGQARALNAMVQSGNMAGSLRNQEFGEQSQVAQARDAINQFNRNNQQNIGNQNVSNRNTAQLTNLRAKQAQANAAAALKNEQQMHNKGLIQQRFQNQTGIAGAKAGIIKDRGIAEQQGHKDVADGIGGAANAIGGFFGGK